MSPLARFPCSSPWQPGLKQPTPRNVQRGRDLLDVIEREAHTAGQAPAQVWDRPPKRVREVSLRALSVHEYLPDLAGNAAVICGCHAEETIAQRRILQANRQKILCR